MFLNQTDFEILSSLKGRTSKLLSGAKRVTIEEQLEVERLFNVIDEMILWNKKLSKTKEGYFKSVLKTCRNKLENSKKKYIQDNIIPLLGHIIEQDWKNE